MRAGFQEGSRHERWLSHRRVLDHLGGDGRSESIGRDLRTRRLPGGTISVQRRVPDQGDVMVPAAGAAHVAHPSGLRRVSRLGADRDDVRPWLTGVGQLLERFRACLGVQPHDGMGCRTKPTGRHRHEVGLASSLLQLVAEGEVDRVAVAEQCHGGSGGARCAHRAPLPERRGGSRGRRLLVHPLACADVPSACGSKLLTPTPIYFPHWVCFS